MAAGEMEAIIGAQKQLATIERNADQLLTALAQPGTRPLAEVAGLVADTNARLEDLRSAVARVEPTISGLLGAEQTPPSEAALDVLWRHKAVSEPPVAPAQSLPSLLATLNALPEAQAVLLEGRSPAANPAAATALCLLCGPRNGPTVAAVIQLAQSGGMAPFRVAIFAPEELGPLGALGLGLGEGEGSAQQAAAVHWPWCESQHLVFRRLAAVAATALCHFLADGGGGAAAGGAAGAEGGQPTALELLALWLATYSDLFSRPCSASGTLLAADPEGGTLLPPLFRPYRRGCRQLWEAAADPARREAYHRPTHD